MKKNILFITNSKIIGGAEICLSNIIKGLKKYPLNPILAYPKKSEANKLFSPLRARKYNIDLGKSTIKYRGLNLYSPLMILDYFKLKRKIKNINRETKIDLIFCQQDPKEKFLTAKIAQNLNIPIIWMEHSKLHPWQEIIHFRLLYNFFSKITNRIIAVSKAVKNSFKKIGVAPNKIVVVLNGVRVKKLNSITLNKLRREWKLKDKIVFGISSRLDHRKGVHELLLASKKAIATNNRIILLIMGSGKEEQNLKDLATRLKITKNIRFVGFQERAPAKTKLFDVVVSPSFDEGEGLPLRIMEGMAHAKPVISTDISGSKEEVFNGVNGYLFKPHDIKKLRSLIIKMAADNNLRYRMGIKSKKIYKKLFTLEKMTYNIYKVIINTINGQ